MRHGFLLVDKPIGPTSHDIVGISRKSLHERCIGHAGTLDPLASGLMVLAVGKKALKVLEYFSGLDKTYIAQIRFGQVSTSYDADGTLEDVPLKPGRSIPSDIDIKRMLEERFAGVVAQVPPAHSALHVDGKRAYELARAGINVQMKTRDVTIHETSIISFTYPDLTLLVHCGSGTYIRSLAHDLGQSLHVGGYLAGLRRTKVGDWHIEDAVDAESITWSSVLPLKDVLKNKPRREVTDAEWEDIRHGRMIGGTVKGEVFAWHGGLPVAVLTQKGEGKVGARKVL